MANPAGFMGSLLPRVHPHCTHSMTAKFIVADFRNGQVLFRAPRTVQTVQPPSTTLLVFRTQHTPYKIDHRSEMNWLIRPTNYGEMMRKTTFRLNAAQWVSLLAKHAFFYLYFGMYFGLWITIRHEITLFGAKDEQ